MEAVLDTIGFAIAGPAGALAQAPELVQSEPFDCAMLDVSLDREMRLPAADFLLQRKLPFFFSTGYGAGAAIPAQFASVPVRSKPYDPKLLLATLEANLVRCGQGIG